MTVSDAQNAAVDASAPTGAKGSLFSQLVEALAEQLDCARAGDVDAMLTLAQKVSDLIDRARAAHLQPDPDCHRQIQSLHEKVRLALALQKKELIERHAQLRRGRGSLQAYREPK